MKNRKGLKMRASRKAPGLISEGKILELLEEVGRPLSLKEILHILGLEKDARRQIRDLLKILSSEGKVVRIGRNRYQIPSAAYFVTGRVRRHPDGYGFIIPEGGEDENVFVNRKNLREAMNNDRVLVRVDSFGKKGREGKIVKVLERASRKVVGIFFKGKNSCYVTPEDQRLYEEIYIPDGQTRKSKPGQVVVVEITRYPTARHGPEGKVIQILGYPDEPEVDVQIVLHKYDLRQSFPQTCIEEARSLPLVPSSEDFVGRMDLRNLLTFTIDGENARDFDDAISLEQEEDGGLKLFVSISDVSHYVKENGALDEEAYRRGTSVYFPDRATPMFPPELSNQICCLHPEVDRLAMTVELSYSRDCEQRAVRFYPSVIRSNARLTYTVVKKMLVERNGELLERYGYLLPTLERMVFLSQKLRDIRLERGGLDFDLPEPEIVLDLQGETRGIIRAERNIAHQIIEEFMIAANEAVARFIQEKNLPFIYRVHEPPARSSVEEFRKFISHLGYNMSGENGSNPRAFQKVLMEVKGKSEERLINSVLLRSMKWAKYSTANVGHFGLASKAYTHFTSPIRRYPDLIVQRILKLAISGAKNLFSEEDLSKKAEHLSRCERIAMEAEREIIDRYRARFMKERLGEVFEGVISSVTPFGFYVELKEVFVEGFVRLSTLGDDYYDFQENRYCLVGRRTHKVLKIGEQVKVKVLGVDVARRHIDFLLA